MHQAKEGDTVQVHYKGQFEDGHVFDTSEGKEPLEFTIGEGKVIPGFESAVIGMAPGETRTERIPAEEAYGPRREELLLEVEKEALPSESEFSVGDWLKVGFPDGTSAPVRITEITDSAVKLDANHPLAGKDLHFELELVKIEN
jgi:peptidylprolyl isomerase